VPRTARFLKNEMCYHVIARASREVEVFAADADYRFYCRLLKKYKERFGIHIFAFCLLPHDVHLVVHVKEASRLSLFMQRVHQSYTAHFNKKYHKTGRLWRGRFKSVALDRDRDLFDCIKYVEFYPVRSELVHSPVEYPWSSCTFRISGQENHLLNTTINHRDAVWPVSSSPQRPQKKKTREVNHPY